MNFEKFNDLIALNKNDVIKKHLKTKHKNKT